MAIRPFEASDYDAIAGVVSRAVPASPATAEQLRQGDAQARQSAASPRPLAFERYVAEHDGAVVGFTHFFHSPTAYHPRKFDLGIYVDPPRQGRGHGAALFHALREALCPYRPVALRSAVREDDARGARFLHDRGFREVSRLREAVLDLGALSAQAAEEAVRRVCDQGIRFRPLSELAGDPDQVLRLHELALEGMRDQPMPDAFTPPTLGEYEKQTLGDPALIREASCVAVADERCVGITSLWRSNADDELATRGTGILRPYRRRGIAWALKSQCALWARARGYRWLRTWMDSRNGPIQRINERFGFVAHPGWSTVSLPLGEGGDR
jgi:GNAT superfamily N-acetyltransferase